METETKEELEIKENVEKTDENTEKINKKKTKKRIKIFGISLWRIFAYFIIYSVVGFFVETTYGAVTKGLVESRQSFLYGPFCAIYGLGACVMIISLQKFKKSHNRLFIGGFIVGAITEYIVSYLGEVIFHVKWWDYSNRPFNINGRICVAFSVFWGILAMYLLGSLNPKIDKLINWIKKELSHNMLKLAVISIVIWMITDMVLTGYAIMYFMVRTIVNFDIDVKNKTEVVELYNFIYSNENKTKKIHKYFGDEKMITTFPRLKVEDINGNVIYFSDLYNEIQPYYYKVW